MEHEQDFQELGGWPRVLARLIDGESLEDFEAECVMGEVFTGRATPAQTGAFLTALRIKGESIDEMVGLVRSMLTHAEALDLKQDSLDVVGTGGDRLRSINVSTIAAFIAAGAGAHVCKHGNRAASSSVGTADVLEALGVAIELGPSGVAKCISEVGMGFCFAQRFHPAMRFAGPVRAQLGVPTIFNFLGPLANPARSRFQLVGVSDPAMAPKMAAVLGRNGSKHAMVVYADDGLDELSVTSSSTVLELVGDGSGEFDIQTWRLDPGQYGFSLSKMQDLLGGDAAFNARAIRLVLEGERSARRDISVLNAGAALFVAGIAQNLESGIELAGASIDDGKAAATLDDLVRVSQQAFNS